MPRNLWWLYCQTQPLSMYLMTCCCYICVQADKASNLFNGLTKHITTQFEQLYKSPCAPCCTLSFAKILAGSGTGGTSFTYSHIHPAIPSCVLNSTSAWLLYYYADAYLTPFKDVNTEAIGLYVIILIQYLKFYTLFSITYSDTSLWNHVMSSFQHSLQYYELIYTYFYTWEVENSMSHPLYMQQRMIQQVLAHQCI